MSEYTETDWSVCRVWARERRTPVEHHSAVRCSCFNTIWHPQHSHLPDAGVRRLLYILHKISSWPLQNPLHMIRDERQLAVRDT